MLVGLILFFLGFHGQEPAPLAHGLGGQDEKGQDGSPDQGQEPVLLDHGDDGGQKDGNIGDGPGQGAGDDSLDTSDVSGHPGQDISLFIDREKTLGHPLQMGIHAVLHIHGDRLGNPGVEVVLKQAQKA